LSANIFEDIAQIESRIDSVITFALIKFVHSILKSIFNEGEIVLLSTVALTILNSKIFSKYNQISILFRKIVVMVLSQSIINMTTQSDQLLRLDNERYNIMLMAFTVATCLLLLVSLITFSFKTSDAVQRSMTLLLYIYADTTEYIVQALNLGGLLVSTLSIFLLVIMYEYSEQLKRQFTLAYILRAFTMVAINMVLQAVIDIDGNATALQYQCFVLITVLFLLDSFTVLLPVLAESRDYAIWKGSQKLFLVVKLLEVKPEIMIFGCLVILYSKPLWRSMLTSVFELALLVVINVILDIAGEYIDDAYTVDKAILLFIYVLIIHESSGLVFSGK